MKSVWRKSALFVGVASVALCCAKEGWAQTHSFDIPAEDANKAIPEFARQAGIQIIAPGNQLRGVITAPLKGNLDTRVALSRLLVGTGTKIAADDGQTIILNVQKAPGPTVVGVPTQDGAANRTEEVVVTGSRLTTGMETPTPVTAMSAEQLQTMAPNNIADALNQLPSLNASTKPTGQLEGASTGRGGQNILNLRGLGDNRTLVLLDGRRMVSTNNENSVDANIFPQNLVARVDIVTGGASAAYGSDAVAGVINFVLDTNFEGLKGDIGAGISTYGDMGSFKGSLAWGGSFLGGKLKIVASTQYFNERGVTVLTKTGRSWFDVQPGLVPNTTGSGPANLVLPDIRASTGTSGGVISAGPLKGTQFLAGGVPAPFNTGFSSGSAFQSGGDGQQPYNALAPDQWRTANFLHSEYSITQDDTIYAEGLFAYDYVNDAGQVAAETGAAAQFTIFSGNPFIPAPIQAFMTANKIASFALGRYLGEYPKISFLNRLTTMHQAIGVKGNDALGFDKWHYDISYSSGQTHQFLLEGNNPISRNIYATADAVINPATGQIVCRSTLSGLDLGCQPINLFGPNSVALSAIPYTIGDSYKVLSLRQNVWQANLSGDLGDWFSVGAGPLSFAVGGEHRTESAIQTVDPLSPTTNDFTGVRGAPASLSGKQGPFRFFNPLPFSGSYYVSEGFLEVGVPILKDKPFARSLNADGAIRYTDYSLAGSVTTWKYGLDYQVIDDIRLRGTVSQDIRAPNLLELFNSSTQNVTNLLYPSSSGSIMPGLVISKGNPNLVPEKAITLTYGVVLTPTFIDGLSLSADYYDIRLKGSIGALNSNTITAAQKEIDFCFQGQSAYCSLITVSNGAVTVLTPVLNLNIFEVEGYDFEAAYKADLLGNPLGLRFLATHETQNFSQAPSSPAVSILNSAQAPSWVALFQAQYSVGDFSISAQERYISEVRMDPTKQQGVFTNNNNVPAVFYTDVTLNYNLDTLGVQDQLYLTINNLFDRGPPVDVQPPSSISDPTDSKTYDRIGRYFTAGLRFKF